MDDEKLDQIVVECVEHFHKRRALGEAPHVSQYCNKAGPAYDRLVSVLEAEAALDRIVDPAVAPQPQFPQPFGEHTLLRELGRGAMGVVYEAVHRPLGRNVALKVLRTGFDTEESALERFRREARACAQVQHDHIIEIYDAGDVDGRLYYSMRLLDGRALDEVARDADLADPVATCRALAEVADALATLHDAGIVHRDVKPSNILVREGGAMVLADFGLARTVTSERLTATGQALGTPLYMSPEQVVGPHEGIDGRADVYALGATLYEVLTGQQMFESENLAATLRMILHERPVAPRDIRPDLPADCERIVLKALEKDKEDRYQSAAEMRDDMRAFASGAQVRGRPVSGAMRIVRRLRRWSPAIAAASLVVTGGALWLVNRPATLHIRTFPTAEARLTDGEWTATPFRLEGLSPGEHQVELRLAGFAPTVESVTLEPGADAEFQHVLIAEGGDTADSPEVLRRLAADLGIDVAVLRVDLRRGAKGGSAFTPVSPLGKVFLAELEVPGVYRLDVSRNGYRAGGEIVFLRGDDVLHVAPFEPEGFGANRAQIPSAVTAALRPGDEITWGHRHADQSITSLASFTVADDAEKRDVTAKLDAIDERLASQPDRVRSNLRIDVLLAAGFHQRAAAEATALFEREPDCGRACAARQEALRRLGLEGSGVWNDVAREIGSVPAETLARWDATATE